MKGNGKKFSHSTLRQVSVLNQQSIALDVE